MNCWDYLGCTERVRNSCPAYPDHGSDCWKITGTLCHRGKIKSASPKGKFEHCHSCEFYIVSFIEEIDLKGLEEDMKKFFREFSQ